jgi:hypothetical protein
MDISRAWGSITENIKVSATECRLFWVETAQTMVWLTVLKIIRSTEAGQISVATESKSNEDNVNNVRCESIRNLRNGKR